MVVSSGQRTLVIQPRRSITEMTAALVSTWKRPTPWRTEPGSAWWKLCHDSPIDGRASHHTLRLSSLVLKGLRPTTWQIELMAKVTWCNTAIRTKLPQKNAVTAPCHDHDHKPPASGGSSMDNATQAGNARERRRMVRSRHRSGANLFAEVACLRSNNQPRWA